MKEDFLHFAWKFGLFDKNDLKTQQDEYIEIYQTGNFNTNAGPDFINSKIKIGNTIWAGNVEIHLKSSDWIKHQHQHDKSYDNVILHVVFEDGIVIKRQDGTTVPCLEMKNRINKITWEKYMYLLNQKSRIPCHKQIHTIDSLTQHQQIERALVERMEAKTGIIKNMLDQTNNDWEETFYHIIAGNFGLKINVMPFQNLAKAISIRQLVKHKNNLHQLEALLFGTAGFLNRNFNDEYPKSLKKEFEFLKHKFNLKPLAFESWKFLRLRPVNFPTIRIAQFAKLIYQSKHLFSKILECSHIKELESLFNVEASDYWVNHYRFDKKSNKKKKRIGTATIQNIIINTVAPILFFYGKQKKNELYQERSLNFLEKLPVEKNNIIHYWQSLNVKPTSAFESQGLIQLYNQYCFQKKCLECNIGKKIVCCEN